MREKLEKKIKEHKSGFCRHHIKELIEILVSEGAKGKATLVSTIKDYISEMNFNTDIIKLRRDQTMREVLSVIAEDTKYLIEEALDDNPSKTNTVRGRL